MARDQQHVTDEEIEEAKEKIHDLFDEVRADMEEDLDRPVPDGGE